MNKFKKSEIFATLISNLFLFLILYLFPFQSKCQSIVYINNSQYGISGNMVFKADTLGNTNWVMDFSGKIVSALSDTNHLQTIASDGKLIYLTSMQTSGTGILQYYPANIVMDTNGMVRAIWYNHISPGGGYSISASVGTTTNGAWILMTIPLALHIISKPIILIPMVCSEMGSRFGAIQIHILVHFN